MQPLPWCHGCSYHYSDVIMDTMASQITSLAIFCSTVCLGTGQRKHQSSASLAFVREIHRWPVNSPHKGPVTRKIFLFDDVIICYYTRQIACVTDLFRSPLTSWQPGTPFIPAWISNHMPSLGMWLRDGWNYLSILTPQRPHRKVKYVWYVISSPPERECNYLSIHAGIKINPCQ